MVTLYSMPMTNLAIARPAVLMVPSLTLFSVISREDYFRRFVEGKGIKGIALPLIEDAGFFFDYTIEGEARPGLTVVEEGGPSDKAINLMDVARFTHDRGLDVYLTLNLAMPELSLASGACNTLDQAGRSSAHCCLNNRMTRSYVSKLLECSLPKLRDELGELLKGIVVHFTDLWPLSAQTGRFLVTCFCNDCVADLRTLTKAKGELDPQWFRGFPNAINLALAETIAADEDGEDIGAISPVTDLRRDMQPEDILDTCSQVRGTLCAKAYDAGVFEQRRTQYTQWARRLMHYLSAKSDITLTACRSIFSAAKASLPNADRILVIASEQYDWTRGVFLDQLTIDVADELWMPISSSTVPPRLKLRPLLARRGCYLINDFFSILNTASNTALRTFLLPHINSRRLTKLLRRSAQQALAEIQREGDALLPESMASNPAAIAVGLDKELAEALIKKIESQEEWR